ncbi:RCC1 domain-containing protein [Actinomadura rubteroloni]|uniref:RCC1 domain-containing protein n=1 Tax=Actinomadura rubteroloni TaxID=1926885 RepID=UPI0011B02991|nr:S8 family serine peptidase [Actinomadura rubteroloni]
MLTALVLAASGLAAPGAAADSQPKTKALYDHGRDKGRLPGTKAPLPAGFSTTQLEVKFRSDRTVRVRGGRPVAEKPEDAKAIQKLLKEHPGAWMRPLTSRPEAEITAQRVKAEKRTGRSLPDLNSWFVISDPGGIEGLLTELNRLPSVEIAQARPKTKPTTEPLQWRQVYRNAAGAATGTGVDADAANSLPGGKGDGVTVYDIEGEGELLPVATTRGSVAAGDKHSLWLDGEPTPSVWAFGDNGKGQLGDGTTTARKVMVKLPGLTGVKALAAAGNYSLALKSDGTVWAWGENTHGQLGDGTTTERHTPVQVTGISTAVAVSAGIDGHALAVLADGTVKAWGNNDHSQLGDGTTTDRPTPVTALTGASPAYGAVAAGGGHSVAILAGGTIKAWGRNDHGQLGNSTTTDSPTPVTVTGLSTASTVAAGSLHTLASLADGTVRSWGDNSRKQLGAATSGDATAPITVTSWQMTNVSKVLANAFNSAAAANDSLPIVWGANESGQLGDGTTTDRLAPAFTYSSATNVPLALGAHHAFLADRTQRAGAWGANDAGQLGDGTTINRTRPAYVQHYLHPINTCHEEFADRPAVAGPIGSVGPKLTGLCDSTESTFHATAVASIIGADDENGVGLAGIAPHAAIKSDGTVYLADAVAQAQPGDVILYEQVTFANNAPKSYPLEWEPAVYDLTVSAVAHGVTVVEPASNDAVNLDDGSDPNAKIIMDRPDSGAIMVGAGQPLTSGGSTCYVGSKPQLSAESYSTYGTRVDVQADGSCVWAASVDMPNGHYPASETDPNKFYTEAFSGTSSASAIIAGTVAALQGVAKNYGQVLAPGRVRDLLKQTGTPQPAGDPHHVGPKPNLRAAITYLRGGIASGERNSLGVKNDGTVWAWGENDTGQLGDGTTTDRPTPVQVTGLTGVRRGPGAVATGYGGHSLAVKADGTVWAWGSNSSGQLGDGTTTSRTTPAQVPGLNGVVAVAAGSNCSLALKADGTVWGWGSNAAGQLGDGTTTQRLTPVQASGLTGVKAIAARSNHALAVLSDGTVRSWGNMYYNGVSDTHLVPTTVSGLTGVATWPGSVAAGTQHSVVTKDDGTVWGWGENGRGQLGDGTTTSRSAPVQATGLTGVAAVGAGAWTSFATKANGTVSAWGYNGNGQLGLGTTQTPVTTPTALTGMTAGSGITGGDYHTLAVQPNGTIYAWGSNYSGQLGDGTTTNRPSPGTVIGTP